MASRLLLIVDDQPLRLRYKEQLSRIVRARWREPHILFTYAIKTAIHFHYAAIARALLSSQREGGALPEAGRSFSRVSRQQKAAAA